jgi:hypothetical protein
MFAGEQPPSAGLDLGQIETELRARLAGVREQIAELPGLPSRARGCSSANGWGTAPPKRLAALLT